MKHRKSQKWWDEYLRWGGESFLVDIEGWGRKDWFHLDMTAEEFYERFIASTHISMPSPRMGAMSDVEEYFLVVCHEDEQDS